MREPRNAAHKSGADLPRSGILYVGSTVSLSFSAERHCNSQSQVRLRWCLVSFFTCVPQWRCDLGLSSEQRVGRVAEYARDEGQQQRFWAALIVLTTAFQLGRCGASNSASIPSLLVLTSAARSILVRRPFSISGRATRRETIARGRTNPMRKRVFGGATSPSSPVRRRSLARLLPSHAADLVLCARVAGPFSCLTASQPTILGFELAYSSSCTRYVQA